MYTDMCMQSFEIEFRYIIMLHISSAVVNIHAAVIFRTLTQYSFGPFGNALYLIRVYMIRRLKLQNAELLDRSVHALSMVDITSDIISWPCALDAKSKRSFTYI
jgi:hypothetical protein